MFIRISSAAAALALTGTALLGFAPASEAATSCNMIVTAKSVWIHSKPNAATSTQIGVAYKNDLISYTPPSKVSDTYQYGYDSNQGISGWIDQEYLKADGCHST